MKSKTQLLLEVVELRSALKPFAGIAPFVERMKPNFGIWVHANNVSGNYVVTVADAIKARDVLAKSP